MNKMQKLWDMVNSCDTLAQVAKAEKVLRSSDINNDDFDELMIALAYISRECYSARRE